MIRMFQTSLDDYEKKIYHRDRDDENSDLEKTATSWFWFYWFFLNAAHGTYPLFKMLKHPCLP